MNKIFAVVLLLFISVPVLGSMLHGEDHCHGMIRLTDTSGAPVDVMISQIVQVSRPIKGMHAPVARAVIDEGNGKSQAVRESQDDVLALLTACEQR